MDKPKITPKDFFLWAGAMVTFYWSVIAYIYLVFDYINYAFPNALSYYPTDPYQSGISYEMASIIVLFPLYLFLMRVIRRDIARDPSRAEVWVRRWALILTLFVAGITAAIDLITLLTTFLNGQDITTAFLLKVAIIFLIAAGVFMHFIADLRGYWTGYPMKKRSIGIAVGILAIGTILSGFLIVGTPAQARLARFDAEKISDLQNIQSEIIGYWQAKQKLPAMLSDLNNSLSYGSVPVDAQTGASYEYKATGTHSFELCATFNTAGAGTDTTYSQPVATTPQGSRMIQNNWQHDSGRTCFERIIDPSFYPPLTK